MVTTERNWGMVVWKWTTPFSSLSQTYPGPVMKILCCLYLKMNFLFFSRIKDFQHIHLSGYLGWSFTVRWVKSVKSFACTWNCYTRPQLRHQWPQGTHSLGSCDLIGYHQTLSDMIRTISPPGDSHVRVSFLFIAEWGQGTKIISHSLLSPFCFPPYEPKEGLLKSEISPLS